MKKAGGLVGRLATSMLGLFGVGPARTGSEDKILSPDDAIMVSDMDFKSADPEDIVQSNVYVVNALLGEYLRSKEISQAALTSYYVDYYLTQVNNGGFSQFVFNSNWQRETVALIRQGLRDMRAPRHLALFEEGVASVEALGDAGLAAYLSSDYSGENAVRDSLEATDGRFFALEESEDLVKLNARWLKRQPNLRVLSEEALRKEVERRAAALPDRAARAQAALDDEPRYMKLIRALCAEAGQTLQRVTAGDRTEIYDGKTIRRLSDEELQAGKPGRAEIIWYFVTDKGVHLIAEAGGRAAMFDNAARTKIAEIDAP